MSKNPVVIIPGIGQSVLVVEDNNGNKIKNAWPVEIDEKALLAEMKSSLMKMLLFRKDSGFSDKVADIVNGLTEVFSGNQKIRPVTVEKSLAECSAEERKYIFSNVPVQEFAEKIGEENVYFFAYNFFGNAEKTAAELDRFITSVKEKTGCKKVDLFVYSAGGAVLKEYLKEYAVKSDCEKIVNFASACDGASVVADIYENRINISNAMSVLSSFTDNASVMSMAGMLPADIIENVAEKSLAVVKKNILDNSTIIRALIPCGENESFAEIAEKLSANGMQFYQICGSGLNAPEIFETCNIDSDGIVDTDSASLSGKFPETTWYFDGQHHINAMYNDVAMSLAAKIFAEEDVSAYPFRNGSRNIRKLKNKLIPKVKKALDSASGEKKEKLEECLEIYKKILAETVITDDENIKQLEKLIEETVKE